MMAYMGGSAQWGTFVRPQGYERLRGISLIEVYKGVGKSVIWACKKGPKGLTDEFYCFKKLRRRCIFAIDSYLKGSAFAAVKRDAKF